MKRFVIIGGAGFIGSNLVRHLLKEYSAEILVLDNFLTGSKENLKGCSIKFYEFDVSRDNSCAAINDFSPDAIVHLASITDTTITEWSIMNSNIEGFRFALDVSVKRNIPLVYASSASVYGNGNTPMKEDQERNPLNIYAESKAKMEDIAKNARDSLPFMIGLRFFNVFGENEGFKGKAASMATQIFNSIQNDEVPRLFKYGEQERDYIYSGDVAKVIMQCFVKRPEYDVLNVGTGKTASFNKLVEYANDALNKVIKIEYFDNPIADKYQSLTSADVTRLKSVMDTESFSSVKTIFNRWARKS